MPKVNKQMNNPHDNKAKSFSRILIDICKSENIKVISMPQSELNKFYEGCGGGFALSAFGQGESVFKVIAYDESREERERQSIVAHEIAHHILGHLMPSCTLSHDSQEFEANIFCLVLMAMGVYKEFERSHSEPTNKNIQGVKQHG